MTYLKKLWRNHKHEQETRDNQKWPDIFFLMEVLIENIIIGMNWACKLDSMFRHSWEKITELKDRALEILQSAAQRVKQLENVTEMDDVEDIRPSVPLIEMSERENGGEAIFEETTAKNFPKLGKYINPQIFLKKQS